MKLPRLVSPASHGRSPTDRRASARGSAGIQPAACGTWSMTQVNRDSVSGQLGDSDVALTYTPSGSSCNCDAIAFVQAVRVVDDNGDIPPDLDFTNERDRRTSGKWNIDRLAGRKYGWYGYDNDNTPSSTVTPGATPSTAAVMRDTPNALPSENWSFESCAICRSGTDANKIYGCKTWGFSVSSSGKVSSSVSRELDTPTSDWTAAVAAWNQQAKVQGSSNKQAADQVPFPQFQ